jgi:5'-methylthioadenosine phosphorylase
MDFDTAFITGTGFYSLPNLESHGTETVQTPFGEVTYERAGFHSNEVIFIARHGKTHSLSPRLINYKANIFALYKLGIKRILSTSVSGSLNINWPPGTMVILDQFLNFTYGRQDTFYPMEGHLAHVDVTNPYCPTLQQQIVESAKKLNIKIEPKATYACMNGPRFETSAEIKMIHSLGGDLVGHTNYPECVLARELAICYASIGVVSNFAAGLMPKEITAREVTGNIVHSREKIEKLFLSIITEHPVAQDCSCHHSLDQAFL